MVDKTEPSQELNFSACNLVVEPERHITGEFLLEKNIMSVKNSTHLYILNLSEPDQMAVKNPLQKCYNCIPKPSYKDIKDYMPNLLNRGWIKISSVYSSSVVCIWNNCVLCVDFRDLECKTIPAWHALPRIQDLLDNLIGNSWMTILC